MPCSPAWQRRLRRHRRRRGLARGVRRPGRAVPAFRRRRGATRADPAVRGDLEQRKPAGRRGPAIGQAIGRRPTESATRSGRPDKTGRWRPRRPDPEATGHVRASRARRHPRRGAVRRIPHDLYARGRRPAAHRVPGLRHARRPGELHPDLVARGSRRAAVGTARAVQQMCIRALDYLPPVDVDIRGPFARAGHRGPGHHPRRPSHHRVAFVEAFRSYGIVPQEVRDDLRRHPGVAARHPIENEARCPSKYVRQLSRRRPTGTCRRDRTSFGSVGAVEASASADHFGRLETGGSARSSFAAVRDPRLRPTRRAGPPASSSLAVGGQARPGARTASAVGATCSSTPSRVASATGSRSRCTAAATLLGAYPATPPPPPLDGCCACSLSIPPRHRARDRRHQRGDAPRAVGARRRMAPTS